MKVLTYNGDSGASGWAFQPRIGTRKTRLCRSSSVALPDATTIPGKSRHVIWGDLQCTRDTHLQHPHQVHCRKQYLDIGSFLSITTVRGQDRIVNLSAKERTDVSGHTSRWLKATARTFTTTWSVEGRGTGLISRTASCNPSRLFSRSTSAFMVSGTCMLPCSQSLKLDSEMCMRKTPYSSPVINSLGKRVTESVPDSVLSLKDCQITDVTEIYYQGITCSRSCRI